MLNGIQFGFVLKENDQHMKQLMSFLLLFITILLSGCSVISGIFKAGVWVGILAVVGVVALIIFIIAKARKK